MKFKMLDILYEIPERRAAISILSKLGIPADESKSTPELWSLVKRYDASFATLPDVFSDNIFSKIDFWQVVIPKINKINSIDELHNYFKAFSPIYRQHPQFISEFTSRKKRILKWETKQ